MAIENRIPAGLLLATTILVTSCGGGGPVAEGLPFAWPPTSGETYPDLQLLDTTGEVVSLSSFAGRVLLIEPIGMT